MTEYAFLIYLRNRFRTQHTLARVKHKKTSPDRFGQGTERRRKDNPFSPNWIDFYFVAAGSLPLSIAVLTVFYQAVAAARMDPVKSLRSE